VLSEAENRLLTQVGPGTPMGDLLRRYWMPIAATAELDDNPTKAVRLMGEDLALYKDGSGAYGLLDRHCAHRRADLSYGMAEDCGLRCNYHGWMYDETGRCIEQPYEEIAHPDANYKDRIRLKAYKVEAKGGLIWAYMGPEPAPLCPTWEPFTWQNGFVQLVFSEVPCNWLQGQENSIDPVHFEWLHSNWALALKGWRAGQKLPTHLKIGFDEFEYGFVYRRVMEGGSEEDELWTVGRTCLWPNCLFTGDHFEWRVPVDDNNTLSVGWFFNAVPQENRPFIQERIPYWLSPIKDERTGRWITSHVMNQDFVAWVGQGTNSDRWNEHLGESDRGVIMMRRRLLDDIKLIADGGEPKALVRDEELNRCVPLPIIGRERLKGEGVTGVRLGPGQSIAIEGFPFLYGQPEEVTRAYNEAMTVKETA
jgi:5,5'-dehydrodivanillate O-demethylase oxygenase subunit